MRNREISSSDPKDDPNRNGNSENEELVLSQIIIDPYITRKQLVVKIGLSDSTLKRALAEQKLGMSGDKVYKLLSKESSILNQYILPNFEMLHT